MRATLILASCLLLTGGCGSGNNPAKGGKGGKIFESAAFARGDKAFKDEDYDLAASCFSKVIEVEPGNAEAWRKRGRCFYNLDKEDKSIADYTEAIRLNPKSKKAFADRAEAYRMLRKFELARADCKRALKIDPNFGGAYMVRGFIRATEREFSADDPDYEKALDASEADYAKAEQLDLRLEKRLRHLRKHNKSMREAIQKIRRLAGVSD